MVLTRGEVCVCGRRHVCDVKNLVIEEHALLRIPSLVEESEGKKPFLVMDENTGKAAGEDAVKA